VPPSKCKVLSSNPSSGEKKKSQPFFWSLSDNLFLCFLRSIKLAGHGDSLSPQLRLQRGKRLRQEDLEFKSRLGYIARSKKKKDIS
jgi:hypothetical protein